MVECAAGEGAEALDDALVVDGEEEAAADDGFLSEAGVLVVSAADGEFIFVKLWRVHGGCLGAER